MLGRGRIGAMKDVMMSLNLLGKGRVGGGCVVGSQNVNRMKGLT